MQTVTTIGLDIAKSVFQVHGVDAAGHVVIRRQLKRRYILAFFQKLQPCLVGRRSCSSLSRIPMTSGCPRLRGCVSRPWVPNCGDSRSRFWSSTG